MGSFHQSTDEPTNPRHWHLVCESSNGVISILKNLDRETAAATYRKLNSSSRPINHIVPTEEDGWPSDRYFSTSFSYNYSGISDIDDASYLSIAVISPDGTDLDPWKDFDPIVVDHRSRWLETKSQGFKYDTCGNPTFVDPPPVETTKASGVEASPTHPKEPDDVRAMVRDYGWFGRRWLSGKRK